MKKLFSHSIALLMCCWFCSVSYQIKGQQPDNQYFTNLEVAGSPFAIGDLDADGDLDAATGQGKYSWHENDGTGRFLKIHYLGTMTSSDKPRLDDINHDNLPDIWTIYSYNSAIGSISWMQNLGGGKFSPAQTLISLNAGISAAAFINIGGSSDDDLVYCEAPFNNAKVYWCQSLGNGTYGPAQLLFVPNEDISGFLKADMDLDGTEDLVCGSFFGSYWIKITGNGAFGGTTSIDGLSSTVVRSLQKMDVEPDGDIDLVVTTGKNQLIWFENSQMGSQLKFHLIKEFAPWYSSDNSMVDMADLDMDGLDDLVLNYVESPTSVSAKLSWLKNLGNNSFSDEILLVSETSSSPVLIQAADWDGDGKKDVFVSIKNSLTWLRNLGLGQVETFPLGVNPISLNAIDVGDMNKDGKPDIAGAGYNVGWWENNGSGFFRPIRVVKPFLFSESFQKVKIAKINTDDLPDLVLTTSGEIWWYKNLGNNDFEFTPNKVPTPISDAEYLLVFDFDKDGDNDIVLGNTSGAQLHPNSGNGNFQSAPITLPGANQYREADMDGDNDLDLVGIHKYTNKIDWLENKPVSPFTVLHNINTGATYQALGLAVANFDNDTDPDVATASYSDDKVAWYENTNSGLNFGPQKIITTQVDAPSGLVASDLNNDSKSDVLFPTDNQRLAWCLNNGNGMFSQPDILNFYPSMIKDLQAANLDGIPGKEIVLLLNNQISIVGNFVPTPVPTIETNPPYFVLLFPNPVQDYFTVRTELYCSQKQGDLFFRVFDVNGKQVVEQALLTTDTQISRKGLPSGCYFYIIEQDGQGYATGKIIFE